MSQEMLEYIKSELARLEEYTAMTDSDNDHRWGSISALESLLEKFGEDD